ncbi:exodeoxyribonuclease VII small subunit [Olsenella sp. YH-ols2217]|uniref:Exodeoxyribonuclease 7 small subunit n=1 Tax=Kribbibacterium absianum TaxID=3044210 RepID=A0ABT6ZI68_9ACTN|nr:MULTISPECIES: exodeoxyribonuclease VII small subunit [unclassified Olsenella]MDJ1121259.1 exodeoxyribonuclease VII small subunit [Olsenella sp. YH-ols2216]MDJ1128749.1 exodeoxyribonuclease VII small subunit [Olsenella sp. YH-ols2217]
MTERPVAEMSFREASVELEQIVRSLEGGDLELEQALAQYQRGVELLTALRSRLADAEQQVRVLMDASAEES